ncbi:TRAP transporter large permease subunit [Ramlibacter tataouinensis]|uniref:Candidate large permease component n=1 Tax=Ramlibacter tataouinensis (strain ATCC BAA-407 / DSM 14655 / LMG 21543 / TTB310) TaxID=365046 RepID=F5XZR7_RAMTT|nr:TRAP transporter large permease subunit [Ramlibacter tataouinensis]AEG92096.1 Candidate large permease component [Ramlibacter tataouinensis TTB310]
MKIRKELWFGFGLMAIIVAAALIMLVSVERIERGHIGLLMLSLVVVAIMLGFPTAFTLMGMGMIFTWLAYDRDTTRTLDLMVQAAFKTMGNDVLIAIPLFVFMGYIVERANLIERLFRSIHLALARLPGALAVATLVTCAIFATATGIVGAVVTLMGLLAMPAMLKAGYSVRLTAGSITAGGCLGILIPPSVLLIVYGATAGVSVVQLYAGAFFPGLMLTGLYILYVVLVAKIKPSLAPPLSAADRFVPLPPLTQKITNPDGTQHAVVGLLAALKGRRNQDVSTGYLLRQLLVVVAPLLLFVFASLWSYRAVTEPLAAEATYENLTRMGETSGGGTDRDARTGLAEPPSAGGLAEPPAAGTGLSEPPSGGGLAEPPAAGASLAEPPAAGGVAEPPAAGGSLAEPPAAGGVAEPPAAGGVAEPPGAGGTPAAMGAEREASRTWWTTFAVFAALFAIFYALLTFARLEVFKMLLTSFFPLMVLILAVLGSIVMGLATPTEAAAVGALGGFVLAIAYRQLTFEVVKESVFLTAKTSAMVCWLFVGSAIFSAAFALLGGQELVERWVLGMNLTQTQFLILSQVIIFVLGWPLEWTEIIVIFMPIFVPLLDNFGVDPLLFGLLVALNLQTAFLSPPVAMSAFYLKGVSPPHVTLNQIFVGMLPFMGIQIVAIVLLYIWPQIGLWLPSVLYAR